MLAIVTNLPEIAITVSAALSGQFEVAVSNILGGIAIQTVVLVALDASGVGRQNALTYQAASLVPALEAALVVAMLAAVVMGSQLPRTLPHPAAQAASGAHGSRLAGRALALCAGCAGHYSHRQPMSGGFFAG